MWAFLIAPDALKWNADLRTFERYVSCQCSINFAHSKMILLSVFSDKTAPPWPRVQARETGEAHQPVPKFAGKTLVAIPVGSGIWLC